MHAYLPLRVHACLCVCVCGGGVREGEGGGKAEYIVCDDLKDSLF